jgi:Flp pilus assembly pilin Flp
MGLWSSIKKGVKSIGKGIKSAFKKIGRGIKSAVGKIGKFMGKIGVVGQLALMFTPIGAMVGNLFSGIGTAVSSSFTKFTGYLAKGGKLAQTAGKFLEAGANFAKAGHSAFRTVTDGVSSFVGEFSKTALKKIPGMETAFPSLSGASDTFFKESIDASGVTQPSAWGRVQTEFAANTDKVMERFDKAINGTPAVDAKTKYVNQKTAEYKASQAAANSGVEVEVIKGEDGSLLDQPKEGVVDYVTNKVSQIPSKIREGVDDFIDTGLGDTVSGGLQNKAAIGLGLQEKPEYTTNQYGSAIAQIEAAPSVNYGSDEMNDRAYQVQFDPVNFLPAMPMGNQAYEYVNSMKRSAGGQGVMLG